MEGLPVGVHHEVSRRSANYHRSIWGDYFLHRTSDSMKIDPREWKQVEELKEEVRRMLMAVHDDSSEKLELIDKIKRLGVSHHFEADIQASLQLLYDEHSAIYGDDDLYVVALGFRLLRQQGHFLSSDVFEKFKDIEGNFEKSLTTNVPAMLCFYEAAHLRVHGEDILEQALVFTSSHLKSMIPILSDSLREHVMHALNQPIRKSLPRVEARKNISIYQNYDTKDDVLLEFAKLDFNLLKKMHKKELSSITSWDTTSAIVNQLSPNIRPCYLAILDVYTEMEEELAKKGETYRLYYAKNELKKLIRSYFEEAKWYHSDSACYVPTFEEYMKVALVSSGYMMVATISLVGTEDNLINKNIMNWVTNEPLIVRAPTVIARLMDDIAGHEVLSPGPPNHPTLSVPGSC